MTAQSLRILLIADNAKLIRTIGLGLQRQESGLIMIEGADSLATARRRLGAGSFDLALVDLGLGEGLHLLSDLREVAPDLPIVALSADGTGPDVAACLAVGALDRLAPEALDSAGLIDRLRAARARAESGQEVRRRSGRIAASLAAAGDLAWYWEAGSQKAWIAAPDPEAWQLPAPECRESLEALRERIHPDDREKAVRRIEEFVTGSAPWQVEARIRVGGGAYRWCEMRGRSRLDGRGQVQRVSGVLSDAQRQQRVARELEQSRRFLRAVYDSDRVPHAVLNSSGIVTDCNPAWLSLPETGCYAGKHFGPGASFIDASGGDPSIGDLSQAELTRGVRQVLGGVAERYGCEYGDGEHRWRIRVSPLLNPGIAGAVVTHEEITEAVHAAKLLEGRLAELSADLDALDGPVIRIDRDFRVLSANRAAAARGRAPLEGRDVLKGLPRVDADAVGAGLAELAGGATLAIHDSRPADGRVTRWLLTARREASGDVNGFLAYGVNISDLAATRATAPVEQASANDGKRQAKLDHVERQHSEALQQLGEARKALAAVEQERAEARQALAAAEQERTEAGSLLAAERQRMGELGRALDEIGAERAALMASLEEARIRAEQAVEQQASALRQAERLAEELAAERHALEAERQQLATLRGALAAAERLPAQLRSELAQARHKVQADLGELLDRAFRAVMSEPPEDVSHDAGPGARHSKR